MLITKVSIKNFNIHEEFEAELRPGINGIVGPNGSGKSSILDAIRFAVTGDSIGEGTKDDNITWGQDRGHVQIEFTHGDSEYTLKRTMGKGASQRLTGPGDVNLTRKSEVNEFLAQMTGTPIEAMLNNVFVAQGAIDAILFATNTRRLKEIQQTVGLGRAAAIEALLGKEVNSLNVTVGLKEQFEMTMAQLEEARAEHSAIVQQANEATSKSQALQGVREKLREATEQELVGVMVDQADARVATAKDAAVTEQAHMDSVTKNRDAVQGVTDTLRPAAESARETLVAFEAGQRTRQMASQLKADLAEIDGSLADITEPDAQEVATLEETATFRSDQVKQLSDMLAGNISHPVTESELKLRDVLTQCISELESMGQRKPSTEEVQIVTEMVSLKRDITTFQGGTCPTCKQDVKHLNVDELARKHEQMQHDLDALRVAGEEAHVAKKAELEAKRASLTGRLETYMAAVIEKLTKTRDGLQATLEKDRSQLTAFKNAKEARNGLLSRQQILTRQLEQIPDAGDTEVDAEALKQAISDYDQSNSRLSELNSDVRVQAARLDAAERSLKEANDARSEITDAGVAPSAEELVQLRANAELLDQIDADIQRLKNEAATLGVKVEQYDHTAHSLNQQMSAEEKEARWSEVCKRARDVLHVSNLPSLVMREYAQILNRRIRYYLEIWEAPFAVSLDSDLAFVATFPDGRTYSAARLSGGQKIVAATAFRFAMADTFASQMGMLILDEPSNYLDKDNIAHFQTLLLKLKELSGPSGKQIILVTHEESLMGFFDHSVQIG